ncbi:hypothetical protein [Brachybacterium sp. AOP29-B2-41]|uniref:hypothetical protein n=1 Tax=Brachybacterium sp. AOP29-B2-41 TaxID=3457704 RepID=UPI004033A5E4
MENRRTFRIPLPGLVVTPVLKLSRILSAKEYIVTFDFHSSADANALSTDSGGGREMTPKGLLWSELLGSPFAYVPATDDDEPGEHQLKLPRFQLPLSTSAVSLTTVPWTREAKAKPTPTTGLILEAKFKSQPIVILPEED